jgi:hypothetical protein
MAQPRPNHILVKLSELTVGRFFERSYRPCQSWVCELSRNPRQLPSLRRPGRPRRLSGRGKSQSDVVVVVPAQEDGFRDVFIGQNCWYAIRISGGMLQKIKYIAAYQSKPTSAVTHYAPVATIEVKRGNIALFFQRPLNPSDLSRSPTHRLA